MSGSNYVTLKLREMDEVTEFTSHTTHLGVEVLTRNRPIVVRQLSKPFQVISEDQVRVWRRGDHWLRRRRSKDCFPLLF